MAYLSGLDYLEQRDNLDDDTPKALNVGPRMSGIENYLYQQGPVSEPEPEPPPEPMKASSGASRPFDLTWEGQVNSRMGKRNLDPVAQFFESNALQKEQQMREQGPGIYAAPEQSTAQKILKPLGGRLLTNPGDVLAEILLSPDRGETIKEVGKDALNLASVGASDFVEKALDDKATREEVSDAALGAGLGVVLTRPGRAALGYAFQGLRKGAEIATAPIRYADEKLAPVTHFIWDNVLVKGANARVIPTLERMPGQDSFVPMKKSFAEIFQPAVERLGPKLQNTFRNTQAMKANVTRIGEELGQDLRNAPALIRYDVMRGLRGTSYSQLDPGAQAILNRYDHRIRDMQFSTPFEIEFKDRLGKLIAKAQPSPQNVFLGNVAPQFLHALDAGIKGKSTLGKVQKALVEAIEDPAFPDELRALAREIHDIPAQLPKDVAEAAKRTSVAYLAHKLSRYGTSVVRATPPPPDQAGEFIKSKFTPFNKGGKALYVKRDVELELRALQGIPRIAHGIFNTYFMTPWKVSKIMLRPASWIRNDISNAMLNHVGGLPFWRMDVYKRALQGMRQGSKEWKDYSRISGAGGSFSVNEVNQLNEGLKYGSNMLDATMSWFDRLTQRPKTMYNAQEQFFKFAKYLHNIEEKGMSRTEAVWDAMKWTFNYGEVTRATARVRSFAAPFFTWQTKILPLMAEAAVKNPVAFTSMMLFYQQMQAQAFDAVGLSEDEARELRTILPNYVKDGMYLMMPWRDDQGRLNMLNMTYMIPGFGDITDIKARPMAWFLSNPGFTIFSALTANKQFSGAPIYYDWEPGGTQVTKMMKYVWEQLMPAVMPGGTDWNAMYEAFTDVPDSLTPTQAIASSLGFKISPLSEAIMQRQHNAMKQIHLAEMGSLMNQELRKARNDEERADILLKYSKLRPQVQNPEASENAND